MNNEPNGSLGYFEYNSSRSFSAVDDIFSEGLKFQWLRVCNLLRFFPNPGEESGSTWRP